MKRTFWGVHTHSLALLFILTLIALLQVASPPHIARAAGVVGSGTPASCSEAALRSAIAGGGSISFNCGPDPLTITLSDSLEVVSKTVDIDGGGKITLSGGGAVRVFYVEQGNLTLRNLTIRDGYADRGGAVLFVYHDQGTVINCRFLNNSGAAGSREDGGGAIVVREGALSVRDSYFEGNTGINGGAIHDLTSALTVERSTFIGNDSSPGGAFGFGNGGAIYTDGASHPVGNTTGGQIVIRDSVFRNNRAMTQGGAVMTFIYPPKDSVLVEGSIFDSNTVLPTSSGTAAGGGLRHGNGPITLRNSLFVGNQAVTGGGFWSGRDFPGLIENVVFVNNRAESAADRAGMGGGLYISEGSFTIRNSTIANNYASTYAGAIAMADDRVSLFNTIVSGNTVSNTSTLKVQCLRNLPGGANNIQSPSTSGRQENLCAGDILLADPKLGQLGDYGGPFMALPILADSPAINAGADCSETDARGASRVGACDIGAFEFNGSAPSLLIPDSPVFQTVAVDGSLLQMSWGLVSGSTRYEVAFQKNLADAGEQSGGTTTQTSLSLVLDRGTYAVKVRACNTAGCSDYSASHNVEITSDPYHLYLMLVQR